MPALWKGVYNQMKYKFRAYNKETKTMILLDPYQWSLTALNEEENWKVMMWTGLLDRNGKEIWEGDIVVKDGYIWFDENKPNYRGTVEFIFSAWQVIVHCVNKEKRGISDGINELLNEDGFDDDEKSEWEVIGNIFQDSHLITE